MHVIATDEAGYGPKLGPLVVSGTTWDLGQPNDQGDLADRFDALSKPLCFGSAKSGVIKTKVDDSKAVFKPGQGNDKLSTLVGSSMQWCGKSYQTLRELIQLVAPDDADEVGSRDWYQSAIPQPSLDANDVRRAINAWSEDEIRLVNVRSRVLTAKRFNESFQQGQNKADLLSQTTLELVRHEIEQLHDDRIEVFCDRHGGRRYYLSVLQQIFPETIVRAIEEGKAISRYQMQWGDRCIDIAFTVKGDRFPPVAMSSIHAKFMREWMMESFNRYFASQHQGDEPLRPTAGYPVDADRFLKEIQETIERIPIDRSLLVRSR